MSRPMAAAALTALAALAVTWLLLALATVPCNFIPSHYVVIPHPTYLAGRLVSMLTA
jgi:hypothetical protein